MWQEFVFRTILNWGIQNPDELNELCLQNALKAATAGDKYISETRHGGKSTRFMLPLTGPGRGEGINMEIAYGLAMKAKWAVDNFSTADLRYLATYPSDRQLGVWWIVSNNPAANPAL